ncbi:oligosaccharide flippase family protein [Embleya sp. NBC_00888]|uniref:oligosaccharide flippase family protein n=1 Tax=Embleya sp. NBC_00888 TaxID=2975960 RepID=UPI00386D3795|nr:oligosaccharide flippase family protein [Embleya sp. NBC_00888]
MTQTQLRRPIRPRVDPLLRNGHVLTVGSLVTSAFGAGYWALATRWYGDATVGRSYAAVSALMLLSGLGQLGLGNVLVRFLPQAGRDRRALIRAAYAAAFGATLVAVLGFLALIPVCAPGLGFLREPAAGCCFAATTVAYALFALQDGALTGLRRPGLVVGKNSGFAVAKIVFVAALAGLLPTLGILMSWTLALVTTLVVVDGWLFARLLPARRREPAEAGAGFGEAGADPGAGPGAGPDGRVPPGRSIVRYAGSDYLGTLCWSAATTLPPIIVLEHVGARESAYFSLAWVVANTLYLISLNMGASLLVEAAGDSAGPAAGCRRVLRHTGALLALAITALVVGAPLVLRVFGPGYARNGSTLLQLLALSALPHLVVSTAISACRVLGRMRVVVAIQAGLATAVLTLTVVLLPVLGVLGAGVAWLAAQTATALALLTARRVWLPTTPGRPA